MNSSENGSKIKSFTDLKAWKEARLCQVQVSNLNLAVLFCAGAVFTGLSKP